MRHIIAACVAALAATPALSQSEQRHLPRADGSSIAFTVDIPKGKPDGILVLAQGSGCQPTATNANLATMRQAFPHYTAVMVEKYGIASDAAIADGFSDCPAAFHAGHTVAQRVADYVSVLDSLPRAPDTPLVLFGGSEGGLAVAMLAEQVQPTATILLSSATGIPFADMVLSTVPPEGHATIEAGFAAARADPQGTALFAGSSHRFWADILDRIPADSMARSTSPFLVVQGGRDTSSPVAAARATADRFAAAGKCNLTYWEFPALDHGMAAPDGTSHLADVATAIARWVAGIGPDAGNCCGVTPWRR
jgi:alpha-beta hydrolase superfamily lysophospholipase